MSKTKTRWDLPHLSESEAEKRKNNGIKWTAPELKSIPPEWHGFYVSDGDGLRGVVRANENGDVTIRFVYGYRFNGKSSSFTCGTFPQIGIAEIRKNRDIAKNDIASGINPNAQLEAKRIAKQQKIDQAIEDEQKRQHELQQIASRTIKEYIANHYEQHQSRKKSGKATINMISHNFSHLLDKDMSLLSKQDVYAWQTERENQGRAYATIQRAYGALKTLLNTAVADEVISFNPLAQISLQPANANSEVEAELKRKRIAQRRALTLEEVESIRHGLQLFAEEERQKRRNSRKSGKFHLPSLDDAPYPHWFIPFTYIALYTGLRSGDIYSLTWNDELNIKFGQLHITPNKTHHHRDPANIFQPLSTELNSIMQAWWVQQGKPAGGLVFPSPVTGDEMHKGTHDSHWQRLVALGNLDKELIFYSLRHNFISTLIAQSVPLFEVAALAGHKDTKMIEEHYGHLIPGRAQSAIDLLEEALSVTKDVVQKCKSKLTG